MNSPTIPAVALIAIPGCYRRPLYRTVSRAEKAGAKPADAAAAITDLADNHVLKLMATNETLLQIMADWFGVGKDV